jgi:hypothetical protein
MSEWKHVKILSSPPTPFLIWPLELSWDITVDAGFLSHKVTTLWSLMKETINQMLWAQCIILSGVGCVWNKIGKEVQSVFQHFSHNILATANQMRPLMGVLFFYILLREPHLITSYIPLQRHVAVLSKTHEHNWHVILLWLFGYQLASSDSRYFHMVCKDCMAILLGMDTTDVKFQTWIWQFSFIISFVCVMWYGVT